MKMRNSYRKAAVSFHRKNKTARSSSGVRFFLRRCTGWILLIMLATLLAMGLTKGSRYLLQAARTHWPVRHIITQNIPEEFRTPLTALAQPYENQPFTKQEALSLRKQIEQNYPMLTQIRLKRSLFSGKLTVSAVRRSPIAQLIFPDKNTNYIDLDGFIYSDPSLQVTTSLPRVELEGKLPSASHTELADLIQGVLTLQEDLPFSFLRMDVTHNTVVLYMPDGCRIDFGPAQHLKQKAERAAQLMTLARGKYASPFMLNFQFYEEGKVFLAQQPH